MSKKTKVSEFDKLYKSLTLKKFIDLMESYGSMNCALAHLAYVCRKDKGKGNLQIPLEKHADCSFKFSIMQHKITKEKILVVEPIDVKSSTIN